MEKSNFDQLLERYLTGKVTAEERVKIEMWLEVMKTENTDDLELSEEDEEKLFQKITRKRNTDQTLKPDIPIIKLGYRNRLTAIAATLIILILASFAIWYFRYDQHSGLMASDTRKVMLEDGTLVWLDPGSTITYTNHKGFRQAELDGSGLFEVAKDPDHPFFIQCRDVAVKVLGTSFRITTQATAFELIVLTGKVEVTTADSMILKLMPNDKLSLVAGKPLQQHVLSETEIESLIRHTEYNMEFANARLEDVLQKLEQKFNVEIQTENDQIKACRITANLTDHSLVSSLERITDVIDIRYEIEANRVTIQGNGCK